MARERLLMHKIREILRQKWCQGRSHRQIAGSLGISTGMVGKIIGWDQYRVAPIQEAASAPLGTSIDSLRIWTDA